MGCGVAVMTWGYIMLTVGVGIGGFVLGVVATIGGIQWLMGQDANDFGPRF